MIIIIFSSIKFKNRYRKVMKRHSLKKASTFKLQGQKNRFGAFLQQIQSCKMCLKYPSQIEMIKKTSQAIFQHCYSFGENSPFLKGLNYGSKQIGFSFNDDILSYKQWLPNISQAYIMGQFNKFNKDSHKMQRQDGDWWHRDIDLNKSHLQDDGSKVILRLIDHQGTQFYMIPPSCHIVSNEYGIVKKCEILPIQKKKLKLRELLAYTIDLQKLSLSQCLRFLQKQHQSIQLFNTIILKNLFKSKHGLLYRYSIELKQLQSLRDIVLFIQNQCGCKLVLEWNLQAGKLQYGGNTVESQFVVKGLDNQIAYDFRKDQVLAYFLANATYFYQNLGIDGIHFTNIQHLSKSVEGSIALKCLNTLNMRVMQSGITLGSSKQHVQALTGQILQGGYGFNFTYNHHQSLLLSSSHQRLYEIITQINKQSNCLAINFDGLDQSSILNLIFGVFLSKKGIFTRGNFNQIKPNLKKILKLRCQDNLFDNQIDQIKYYQQDQVYLIKRGVLTILVNFSQRQVEYKLENIEKMQLIFTHNAEKTVISEGKVILSQFSCILLQMQQKFAQNQDE